MFVQNVYKVLMEKKKKKPMYGLLVLSKFVAYNICAICHRCWASRRAGAIIASKVNSDEQPLNL